MQQKISFSTYAIIGTMLFGMFFGAGNLIYGPDPLNHVAHYPRINQMLKSP